ncbi:MAG TPA: rod shape-determining protein MreD [Firmicutes bacterium]|nr:rod shape-determining protein MreD [Bacillota bacterium]
MRQSTRRFLKWALYALLLFVFYILQSTPLFLSIQGIKPALIIPYLLAVAMFEGELAGCIYGIAGGFLWDIASGRLPGFSSLVLMILCIAAALMVMYLLRANLVNAMVFCGISVLLYFLLDYLFCYVMWGLDPARNVLLGRLLPVAGYTLVMMIPIYYFVRGLSRKLNENPRI